MKASLNLILAASASLLVVSCYPYPENRPPQRPGPAANQKKEAEQTEAEVLKKKEEAEKKIQEEERLKKEEELKNKEQGDLPQPDKLPKPTGTVKTQYDVAKKAPGKEGFVLSPYNNKLIDVRGIKPGTLVMDPTYDPSEKKYFRVP